MDSLDDNLEAEQSGVVRKRHREQRIAGTVQKIHEMKQKMVEAERKQEQWLYWRPILFCVGAGEAISAGLLAVWSYLSY